MNDLYRDKGTYNIGIANNVDTHENEHAYGQLAGAL